MNGLCASVLWIAVCFMLIQCTKSSESFSHTEFEPYFDLFEQEAAIRGFTYDLKALGVIGQIVPIKDDHVAGRCKHTDRMPAMVLVDQEFWKNSNIYQKEFVIFHELGHCILGRSHRNEALESGECISLMASDNRICASVYMPETRERYLDELFYYSE